MLLEGPASAFPTQRLHLSALFPCPLAPRFWLETVITGPSFALHPSPALSLATLDWPKALESHTYFAKFTPKSWGRQQGGSTQGGLLVRKVLSPHFLRKLTPKKLGEE